MRNALIAIFVIVLVLALCAWALSMATEYPQGLIAQQPAWPAGLADVLNSQQRIYGYWTGSEGDYVFYRGGTSEFNAFMGQLSRLKSTPVFLVMHQGRGIMRRLGDPGGPQVPFDWKVSITTGSSSDVITVDLWLDGHVYRDNMVIPDRVVAASELERALP